MSLRLILLKFRTEDSSQRPTPLAEWSIVPYRFNECTQLMRFLQDFANFSIGNKYLDAAFLFIQALLLDANQNIAIYL